MNPQQPSASSQQPLDSENLQRILQLITQPPLDVTESLQNSILQKQVELRQLVETQKIENYKFQIQIMEMNSVKIDIEKLENENHKIVSQLEELKYQIQLLEAETITSKNQIEQLQQETKILQTITEQLQLEMQKMRVELVAMKKNNEHLLVLRQLAFTFEYHVNLHNGNTKKPTPFKTMVDQSTKRTNPKPLPTQLTNLFNSTVDEHVLSYEVEQLKCIRLTIRHNFEPNSVTEDEFREILSGSYSAANDDAVEFIVNYIKMANNGKFELRNYKQITAV